jgi:hypothetical protein
MIYVRAERSKKEDARKIMQKIYDGTKKQYPRGDMMLFIPIISKLEDEYSPDQRDKFIFNHERFLGDEDCTAIFGLCDLNNVLTLKNNSKVSIRTLLKGIPSHPAMSKPRLFHIVDPNATQQCTLVTFQKGDRSLVAESLDHLQDTLISLLAPNQLHRIFLDPKQGIRFVTAYHKFRGKFVKVHDPSPEHVEFLQRSESILTSPPKKRPTPHPHRPAQTTVATTAAAAASLTYSGIVQQSTTCTRSVEQQPSNVDNNTTTTTTTLTSQTFTAVLETGFQAIERQVHSQQESHARMEARQVHMDNRLSILETQNGAIGSNIMAMMAHLKIPTVTTITNPTILEDHPMTDAVHANHTVAPSSQSGDTCL